MNALLINMVKMFLYFSLGEEELTPLIVSSRLNGISCSLSFHRDYNIKFVALLKEVLCY